MKKNKFFFQNKFEKQFKFLNRVVTNGYQKIQQFDDIDQYNVHILQDAKKVKNGFYKAKICFKKRKYNCIVFIKKNNYNTLLDVNIFNFQNIHHEKIVIDLTNLILPVKKNDTINTKIHQKVTAKTLK